MHRAGHHVRRRSLGVSEVRLCRNRVVRRSLDDQSVDRGQPERGTVVQIAGTHRQRSGAVKPNVGPNMFAVQSLTQRNAYFFI